MASNQLRKGEGQKVLEGCANHHNWVSVTGGAPDKAAGSTNGLELAIPAIKGTSTHL
jgi:hypothetical protein